MKNKNLIALIIVSVLAIGILLWKSGVFAKSGKKENDNDEDGQVSVQGVSFSRIPQNGAYVELNTTTPSIARLPRNESYTNLNHLTTLNSPETIAVNYGKQKR